MRKKAPRYKFRVKNGYVEIRVVLVKGQRAETIARLLHQIETERWGAAAIIAVIAGLRKGEVLALRWEDIEWSVAGFPGFGAVTIGRQVQRVQGQGLLVREVAKTDASEANRPLPPVALAALERRRMEQSEEVLRAPKAERGHRSDDDRYHWRGEDIRPGRTGFIFTSDVGTIVDPRNFDRWFSVQCTKVHMPKGYTFHRLRHDYASILLRQGVKDRVAQEMLRHIAVQHNREHLPARGPRRSLRGSTGSPELD